MGAHGGPRRPAHRAGAWSRRQLLEVMVDFWSNHLNVTCPLERRLGHRGTVYDRDVIRKHALGRFSDMLMASAKHPAMLQLPRQRQSAPRRRRTRTTAASCSSCTPSASTPATPRPTCATRRSAPDRAVSVEPTTASTLLQRRTATTSGTVTVLGFSRPQRHAPRRRGGRRRATSTTSPTTRRPRPRIATQAAPSASSPTTRRQRWSAGSPRSTSRNDTAIAPVLRALFTSPEFAALGGAEGPHARSRTSSRPCASSACGPDRQTGPTALRQPVLGRWHGSGRRRCAWPAPNGYPDVAAAWSAARARWPAGTSTSAWPPAGARNDAASAGRCARCCRATLPDDARRPRRRARRPAARSRRCRPRSATRSAPSSARRGQRALRRTDAALDWRLPYVVALAARLPHFATR